MNIALIVVIVSGLLVIAGVKAWQDGKHLLANGLETEAIVFSNEYKGSGNGGGSYYPVVRFTTEEDEWITQKLDVGFSPAKPEGTKLRVIYDPNDPSHIEINTNATFQLSVAPVIIIVIGTVGVILGILEYLEWRCI